ncbi:MAG: cation:dicarboxylase symporter family transporter [Pirellulaceae bacterium]
MNSPAATQSERTTNRTAIRIPRGNLTSAILCGLGLGIATGLFLGEYCAKLTVVGDMFVGLLRMTALPYIIVSLIANLGRLSRRQSRRLAMIGGLTLATLWSVALFNVFALSNTFPEWKSGSFFSTAIVAPPREIDLVSVFIPANIFDALADNHVPAVVLMCICVGLALSGISNREVLITQLDILGKALIHINYYVVRLTPIGVFAIAASTTGTISLAEAIRLQAYFVAYTAGSLFVGFVVLPWLVATCTPFRYRDVLTVSRDAMITAFATGKLIVVLPLLIVETEKLVRGLSSDNEDSSAPAVDVLYPVAYPMPHVGKLLGLIFIPFAAWFSGHALAPHEYPAFLSAGLFSYFSGPIVATPFLLDMLHLPHDMFQLFLLSGVYGERLGDALGAIHFATFTLISTSAFLGKLRIQWFPIVRFLGIVTVLGVAMCVTIRFGLSGTLRYVERKEDVIAHMQLLEQPARATVVGESAPNPDPLLLGESLLHRVRRRGVLRVGYNEDKLPFAFFNIRGELVGFDINLAHALARDLGVRLEFVRFDRDTLQSQLSDDHFDIVMSGLVGTLERSRSMQHTTPYMDVTLALVVPDYRAREFRSLDSLRAIESLRIGFVDLSRGFVDRLRESLPQAEFVELSTSQQFFDGDWQEYDALLISAESGSAFTLLYPEFEVVVPAGRRISMPLFYAIGARDAEMRDFLEHWMILRKKDGTMQQYYDHWILGKVADPDQRRWSVVRDVLHWVE